MYLLQLVPSSHFVVLSNPCSVSFERTLAVDLHKSLAVLVILHSNAAVKLVALLLHSQCVPVSDFGPYICCPNCTLYGVPLCIRIILHYCILLNFYYSVSLFTNHSVTSLCEILAAYRIYCCNTASLTRVLPALSPVIFLRVIAEVSCLSVCTEICGKGAPPLRPASFRSYKGHCSEPALCLLIAGRTP
jgi:ABC-type Co2+ transport system permease subunit